MKGSFYLVVITVFLLGNAISMAQTVEREIPAGSWINNGIIDHFTLENVDCSDKFWSSDDILPSYLSFDRKGLLHIAFRYEQHTDIAKINKIGKSSYVTGKMKLTFLSANEMQVQFDNRNMRFTKVSKCYSEDVFSDFLKYLLFKNDEKYRVIYNKYDRAHNGSQITKNNFDLTLKKIFRCSEIWVLPIGYFNYKELCLPQLEIATKKNSREYVSRKTIALLIQGDSASFIDDSGEKLLVMASR